MGIQTQGPKTSTITLSTTPLWVRYKQGANGSFLQQYCFHWKSLEIRRICLGKTDTSTGSALHCNRKSCWAEKGQKWCQNLDHCSCWKDDFPLRRNYSAIGFPHVKLYIVELPGFNSNHLWPSDVSCEVNGQCTCPPLQSLEVANCN